MKSHIAAFALICLLVNSIAPALADRAAGIAAYEREDYEAAYRELQPLAETGDAEAQWYLGRTLHFGKGTAHDVREAVQWYRHAADQGHPGAMQSLGDVYTFGEHGERDSAKAASWYRKAADLGLPEAMYTLGLLYDYGWGVPRDGKTAQRWYAQAFAAYRPAAVTGDPEAQFWVARMYHFGQGVAQDMREAVRYYRSAADANVAAAQMVIGDWHLSRGIYQPGDYRAPWPHPDMLKPDMRAAYEWFARAADNGYPGAAALRDNVLRQMTPINYPD